MQKPKTIKLDKDTVVKISSINSVYKYNKWRIKVYINNGCFTIKFSRDITQVDTVTDLFLNSLEILIDPQKGKDGIYDELSHDWYNFDGTFKEFIIKTVKKTDRYLQILD